MRLLLDQGLPRGAIDPLRTAGIPVVHTGDEGLAAADDLEILAWARAHRRIIVTLDADFHAAMALSGARRPSVVRIRIEGLKAEPLAALLRSVLAICGTDLVAGALVSVTHSGIRVRSLPITRRARPK